MIRVQSVIQRALQQHGLFARFQLEQLGIPEGSHTKILKNSLLSKKLLVSMLFLAHKNRGTTVRLLQYSPVGSMHFCLMNLR